MTEVPPRKPPPDTPQATPKVAFFTPVASVNRNETVSNLIAHLNESLLELYEERAAILEFDAGLTRDHAECLALLNIYRDYPLEVLGVVVLCLSADEYVLTTNATELKGRGLEGRERVPVDQVVAALGGVVRLTAFE